MRQQSSDKKQLQNVLEERNNLFYCKATLVARDSDVLIQDQSRLLLGFHIEQEPFHLVRHYLSSFTKLLNHSHLHQCIRESRCIPQIRKD